MHPLILSTNFIKQDLKIGHPHDSKSPSPQVSLIGNPQLSPPNGKPLSGSLPIWRITVQLIMGYGGVKKTLYPSIMYWNNPETTLILFNYIWNKKKNPSQKKIRLTRVTSSRAVAHKSWMASSSLQTPGFQPKQLIPYWLTVFN